MLIGFLRRTPDRAPEEIASAIRDELFVALYDRSMGKLIPEADSEPSEWSAR